MLVGWGLMRMEEPKFRFKNFLLKVLRGKNKGKMPKLLGRESECFFFILVFFRRNKRSGTKKKKATIRKHGWTLFGFLSGERLQRRKTGKLRKISSSSVRSVVFFFFVGVRAAGVV